MVSSVGDASAILYTCSFTNPFLLEGLAAVDTCPLADLKHDAPITQQLANGVASRPQMRAHVFELHVFWYVAHGAMQPARVNQHQRPVRPQPIVHYLGRQVQVWELVRAENTHGFGWRERLDLLGRRVVHFDTGALSQHDGWRAHRSLEEVDVFAQKPLSRAAGEDVRHGCCVDGELEARLERVALHPLVVLVDGDGEDQRHWGI